MQQLSIAGLSAHFEQLLRKFPEEKRALFERLEPQLEAAVRRTIGGSGKVASWQEGSVGSKGGYAAVRPMAKTFHKGYAVGQITNAVTSGHRTTKGTYVPGKHYYESAATEAGEILGREVRALETKLKEAVEA